MWNNISSLTGVTSERITSLTSSLSQMTQDVLNDLDGENEYDEPDSKSLHYGGCGSVFDRRATCIVCVLSLQGVPVFCSVVVAFLLLSLFSLMVPVFPLEPSLLLSTLFPFT